MRINAQFFSRLCFVVIVILIGVRAWSRLAATPSHLPTPAKMGDYRMFADWSAKACEEKKYPPNFVYPPPALLFWDGLHSLGTAGELAWLLIVPGSMLGCLILADRMTRKKSDPYGGMVVALAFVALEYYMIWDLKVLNVNSLYFVLILFSLWSCLKKWPVMGGTLLATTIALKLYSVTLIPYLVIRREWRMLIATLISLAILFVGVPVLFLGWHDALLLGKNWIVAVQKVSRPDYPYVAYKVSPAWVALVLFNPDATAGKLNLLNWDIASIVMMVRVFVAGWGLLVVGYFAHAFWLNRRLNSSNKQTAFLLDVSVLLIWLLPGSTTLQPHHLVVLFLPAICLLHIAFDTARSSRMRLVGGLTVVLGFCFTEFGPSYPLRGIGVMLTLLTYLAGIWMVRHHLSSEPEELEIQGPVEPA